MLRTRIAAPGLLLLLSFLLASALRAEPLVDPGEKPDPGRVLLQRSFENLYASDASQIVRVSSGFESGREMTYRIEIFRKQSSVPPKTLIRFVSPPDLRGTSVLVIERKDRSDDIFVHLPALRATRRVAGFQKADSFFGTNISYEDLEAKHHENYEVRQEGSERIGSAECIKLETRARDGFESSYERTVSCIDPERAVALWTEFYKGGDLLKRLEVQIESIKAVHGKQIPYVASIASARNESQTELSIESYEPNANLPDRIFNSFSLDRHSSSAP